MWFVGKETCDWLVQNRPTYLVNDLSDEVKPIRGMRQMIRWLFCLESESLPGELYEKRELIK